MNLATSPCNDSIEVPFKTWEMMNCHQRKGIWRQIVLSIVRFNWGSLNDILQFQYNNLLMCFWLLRCIKHNHKIMVYICKGNCNIWVDKMFSTSPSLVLKRHIVNKSNVPYCDSYYLVITFQFSFKYLKLVVREFCK